MLPAKTCDSLTCLQSLVKVKSNCVADDCAEFYLEDIEGADISSLSEISNVNSPSGKMLGSDLINIGAREMLADIELLIGQGYSLIPTFGELCSSCTFVTTSYVANARVKVSNLIATKYSILQIHSLQVLANYTGAAVLVIDDLKTPKYYDITLVAGEVAIITFTETPYSTTEKNISVYLQDTTIPLAKINCPSSSSGCGCGGSANRSAARTINYSGFVGITASQFQYGFLICASVVCSSDLMVCDLIKQVPKLFAMTLLYKVGSKYYSDSRLSKRNNKTAGQNGEEKLDMQEYYEGLYKTRLQGTKITKGLNSIISQYLKQRNDKCVVCEGTTKQGWAIG